MPRRTMRLWASLIVLAQAMPALADRGDEIVGRASVIDGDTIEIAGERIRFDGIDAPESRQTCINGKGAPYRCGRAAADALDAFLARSRPTTCVITGKNWDRWVGICRRADGRDVNRFLVLEGLAIDWPKYSRGRYAREQRDAELAKRGLWSGRFDRPCVVRRAACD